jgi:hypothetical protein
VIAGVVSYMLLCWGVVFVGLVSPTSSPYSSDLLVPGGGFKHTTGMAHLKMQTISTIAHHIHVMIYPEAGQ